MLQVPEDLHCPYVCMHGFCCMYRFAAVIYFKKQRKPQTQTLLHMTDGDHHSLWSKACAWPAYRTAMMSALCSFPTIQLCFFFCHCFPSSIYKHKASSYRHIFPLQATPRRYSLRQSLICLVGHDVELHATLREAAVKHKSVFMNVGASLKKIRQNVFKYSFVEQQMYFGL